MGEEAKMVEDAGGVNGSVNKKVTLNPEMISEKLTKNQAAPLTHGVRFPRWV